MNKLALLTGLLLGSLGCNQPNAVEKQPTTFDKIREEKVLRVGYISFAPCVVENTTTKKPEGHFVDAIEQIAKESSWKVEYTASDWSSFTAGLASKRFDVCIAPTFTTIPRSLAVTFTQPLMYAGNSAVARKGDVRFTTIAALDRPDVTVAVTQGEAGAEYAQTNFKQAKVISTQGPDQSLTFQNVLNGRADVALGDAYATAQFVQQHPDEVVDVFAANPYNLTPVSWTVRTEDTDLLEFLNNALSVLDTRGLLLEYEKKAGAHWLHLKKDYIAQ